VLRRFRLQSSYPIQLRGTTATGRTRPVSDPGPPALLSSAEFSGSYSSDYGNLSPSALRSTTLFVLWGESSERSVLHTDAFRIAQPTNLTRRCWSSSRYRSRESLNRKIGSRRPLKKFPLGAQWCGLRATCLDRRQNDVRGLLIYRQASVLFHPCDIPIHPVLQKLFAVCTDISGFVKQPISYTDECFGLPKRRHVQICENVP